MLWVIYICWHSIRSMKLKLNNGTFQIINHFYKFSYSIEHEWNLSNYQSFYKFSYSIEDYLLEHRLERKHHHLQLFMFFIWLLFHLDFWRCNQITAISNFLYMKAIFPGKTPVPPRLGTWIFDLSRDSIWAIWLAEGNKFNQNHDRIMV